MIRFETSSGEVLYGEDQSNGQALVLEGDPFVGFSQSSQKMAIERRLAPIEPVNIFCTGLNYRAHAEETGALLPENPVIFMKPTTSLNHPEADIRLPAWA